ncbi:hypothetical protein AAHZ94_31595 [Streptomyces sp. HSW2009]|uniref:hypothetical protein n=1 Tax=Streptomyces sp. HSW2009 TaxID=3142890 RepID=UPI0032ECD9BE
MRAILGGTARAGGSPGTIGFAAIAVDALPVTFRLGAGAGVGDCEGPGPYATADACGCAYGALPGVDARRVVPGRRPVRAY